MRKVSRRTALKTGLALGASALAAPPILSYGQGESSVKIGDVDPQTGTYAALGGNQIEGGKLALEDINKAGGIMGRKVELLVEDSAANVGTSVQKAHKLIDKDGCSFLVGTVSSAVSLAVSQVAHQKNTLFVDSGGHTTPVTGKRCNWSTFRICSTTWMLAAGNAKTLADKFGKRWFFMTPDYAFGHTEQAAYAKLLKGMGGTVLGNALAPLGTTDFSSYLIQAKQAKPDVLIVLQAGNDLVNALKQAVQFGLEKNMAIGGGLMELEVLRALPDAARLGWWTFEWWWDQPGVAHVADWVDRYRKAYNHYPTARSWFGYAAVHAVAMAANDAKSLDSLKVSHAMAGMELPPEVALQPNKLEFRKGDHQLMTNEFPGQVNRDGKYPHLFKVARVVPASETSQSVEEKGCKMVYPS